MVTGVFLFTACTCWRPRALKCRSFTRQGVWRCVFLLAFLALLSVSTALAQDAGNRSFDQLMELPPWFIKPFGIVERQDHPLFGQFCAALGDVNGDGYDDVAVSTFKDTTFIFFGGDTLDAMEDGFVLGGSGGVVALDLNGDGLRDLVTTVHLDNAAPEERGLVRVFFQFPAHPHFNSTPDLTFSGVPRSRLRMVHPKRSGGAPFDYNGDGYPDLVLATASREDSTGSRNLLHLGGPAMDTLVDGVFRSSRPGPQSSYASDFLSGDLDGDGYDDLLVGGAVYSGGRPLYYWDLYPGNKDANTSEPRYTFMDDVNWCPAHSLGGGSSAIMDLNVDGYADIIDKEVHRIPGDALCYLSGPVLPNPILPNDSIPNRDPGPGGDIEPGGIYPVGDMNGDGTRDVIIGWGVYMIDGILYLMYPASSTSFKRPMGYRGIISLDWWVEMGVYDAGDINGDGCDDIIMLGKPTKISNVHNNRFVVFLGARQMQTGLSAPEKTNPNRLGLQVYPNPLYPRESRVELNLNGLTTDEVVITIVDVLGRTCMKESLRPVASTLVHSLAVPGLLAGTYHITVRQARAFATTLLHLY